MEGFALYALIGLLLLVPLEMLLLVLVAALARKRELSPSLAGTPRKRQERYGWEDMLKLSLEKKPSGRGKVILSVIVILLLVVIVAAPNLFLVSSPFHLNLSRQPANYSVILPPAELNETGVNGIFSNLTLPKLNLTVPDINRSKFFAPLKLKAITSFAVSAKKFALDYSFYILAGFVSLAISIFLLRFVARKRRELA